MRSRSPSSALPRTGSASSGSGSRVRLPDGTTEVADLSAIPTGDASAAFEAPVPCADECIVTGNLGRDPARG